MSSRLEFPAIPRNMIYGDVGAREGLNKPWKYFRHVVDLVGFEPDEEEFEKLLSTKSPRDSYYKCALSNDTKDISLNLTKSRGCSSVLKPNRTFLDNFPDSNRFDVEKLVTVKSTTLDALYKKGDIRDLDFLKIDVQGFELDILQGGQSFLKEHVLGIEVEVEFHQLYKGQPLFSDIDNFIRNNFELELQDLKKTYWKYPEGIGLGGAKGKLLFADALYFRSPQEIISWCSRFDKKEASIKIQMACLMGIIYGYLDYSLCLLKQPRVEDFICPDVVNGWISLIHRYGKSLRYTGKSSSKFAGAFHMLYRMFQPDHEGWASSGHHLGMEKKFGVFR